MENGNEQKGRPKRSTLAEELEKLALSEIPVEISFNSIKNCWEARVGGLCSLMESFASQWDIVPWLRRNAELMYPNSKYALDCREFRKKNHDHNIKHNVNRNNNRKHI